MKKENNRIILLLHLTNRIKNSNSVQKILTKYGCSIKTRVGLHETSENFCSDKGLIMIELTKEHKELLDNLKKIEGLEIKKILFKN